MKSIVFFILIIIPSLSFSQGSPGYLGKKMIAGYQMRTFPSFKNPNSETANSSDDISTSLNIEHYLFFDRVVGRKSSLGANVGYLSTFFLANNTNSVEKVNALSFNVSYKHFSFHSAPMGIYTKVSLGVVQINPSDHVTGGSSRFSNDITITGISKTLWNLGLGYGVNRIIADKLVLGLGFEFNLNFSGLAKYTADDIRSFDADAGDSEGNQEILTDRAIGRVAIHNLLNFKLSVGYIF